MVYREEKSSRNKTSSPSARKFQKQIMSADFPSLPRILEQINTINKTKIPWEEFRGKGLPDSSTNAWSVIVNLFQEGGGQRNDQSELDKFFNGIHAGHRTYNALNERLRLELKRRGNGKISDCARINKQQKSMALECAPSTTPALAFEGAAAAEGSSSRPDGAAAWPRLRPHGGAACLTMPRGGPVGRRRRGVRRRTGRPFSPPRATIRRLVLVPRRRRPAAHPRGSIVRRSPWCVLPPQLAPRPASSIATSSVGAPRPHPCNGAPV